MAVRRLTTPSLAVVLALVGGSLAACQSKSHSSSSGANGTPTSAASSLAGATTTGGSSAGTGTGAVSAPAAVGAVPGEKVSGITMRVVNLYGPKADSGSLAPGPALDIYDVQLTGQAATPVAKNVAYGSASPYFPVHVPTNSIGNPAVQLFALPAGEDPTTKQADAKNVGGAIDDGSHAQITELLVAENSGLSEGGALGRLASSARIEKGDDGNGGKSPVAPPAPAGQGEILVDPSAVADQNFLLYLLIDSSCAPPINGDPLAKGLPEIFAAASGAINSAYAIFPTTPGSHQVSVVNYPAGASPTCDQLTAKQGTTTVNVTDGEQVEAYVYGTSATDLHLALAPIKQ
jgi:hypothetical protein